VWSVFHPEQVSTGGTRGDNEEDGKLPAKKVINVDKVKAGSTKHKIDQVLQGTGN